MSPVSSDALILFGISGNLARKMLFEALYDLTTQGELDMPVIGVASSDWDDEALRDRAREALEENGESVDEEVFARLAANLSYVAGDYRDATTYQQIADRVAGAERPVSYLAIPPDLFDDVVQGWPRSASTEKAEWSSRSPSGAITGRRAN